MSGKKVVVEQTQQNQNDMALFGLFNISKKDRDEEKKRREERDKKARLNFTKAVDKTKSTVKFAANKVLDLPFSKLLPEGTPLSSFKRLPKQVPQPTLRQATELGLDFTVRPLARVGAEAAKSIEETITKKKKPAFKPKGHVAEFLYGKEPIRSYSDPERPSRKALKFVGAPEQLAPFLIGAGIVADVTPIGKGKKGLKLAEEAQGPIKKGISRILEVGGGKYNLGDLNVADDVFDAIKEISKKKEPLIATVRRGKQTFKETQDLAHQLNLSPEKLIKSKVGKTLNAEELTAAGNLVKSTREKASALTETYRQAKASGQETPLLHLQALEALNEASMLETQLLGKRTEAGRALNSLKIIKEVVKNPDEIKIQQIYKQFGGKEGVDEIINKFNEVILNEGEVAAYKFIRNLNKPKFTDYIQEFWYNNLLSSPSTQIINSLTNLANVVFSPIERVGAGLVDAPLSRIAGRQQERFVGEAAADVIGGFSGIIPGVRKGLFTLFHGFSLEDASKLEMRRPESFLTGKFGAVKPTRWMQAADNFFKSINYSADIHAQAYRTASKEGLKGKSLLKKTAELIQEPTTEMIEKAGKMAKYRVFQEEPGKITSSVMNVRNKVPGARFILPFLQTPVNILKYGRQRSPIAFLTDVPFAKGGERSDAVARAVIGSGIATGVAVFAAQGHLTGAPPKDKAERDAFYRSGKLPYSIKIGDKWVSYQRLEPFNQTLTQVSALYDGFITNKDAPLTSKAEMIANQIGRNLVSQTYLSGINNILNVIEDPERYAGNFLENFAVGFIPGSSFLRSITRVIDPAVRNPEGIQEALMATIPGLSFKIEPKRNVFGEEIKNEGGWLRQIFPIKYSKEKQSGLESELKRLGIMVSFPSETPFSKLGKSGRKGYDKFLNLEGGLTKQWISNFISQSDYNGLSDEDKIKGIEKIKDASRAEYRSEILASVYLTEEKQKGTLENKIKFYDEMVKEGVITDKLKEWIIYLRNQEDRQ